MTEFRDCLCLPNISIKSLPADFIDNFSLDCTIMTAIYGLKTVIELNTKLSPYYYINPFNSKTTGLSVLLISLTTISGNDAHQSVEPHVETLFYSRLIGQYKSFN